MVVSLCLCLHVVVFFLFVYLCFNFASADFLGSFHLYVVKPIDHFLLFLVCIERPSPPWPPTETVLGSSKPSAPFRAAGSRQGRPNDHRWSTGTEPTEGASDNVLRTLRGEAAAFPSRHNLLRLPYTFHFTKGSLFNHSVNIEFLPSTIVDSAGPNFFFCLSNWHVTCLLFFFF